MAGIDIVLNRLKSIKSTGPDQWMAQCPCHDDRRASLSIKLDRDKWLFHCHAGCQTERIIKALGLQMSDLFLDKPVTRKQAVRPGPMSEQAMLKGSTAHFDYRNERDQILYRVVRYPRGKDGKTFAVFHPDDGKWLRGLGDIKPVLYRLPELLRASKQETAYILEGEGKVDTLIDKGFVATCNPFGAGKWSKEFNKHLRGRHVVILPDKDEPGKDHAEQVAKSLKGIAKSVHIVELPVGEKEDVADFFNAGRTKADLIEIVEDAVQPRSTWADFGEVIGPITWAWGNWLPNGLLTILAGESGCGKSALALRIAASFVSGDPFPDGSQYASEVGEVLWCETEAAQRINYDRATAWGLPQESFINVKTDVLDDIFLDDPETFLLLKTRAHHRRIRLIVVDSFSAGYRGKENSSQVLSIVVKLATLARDTGKPVLVIHHFKKAPREEGRVVQDLTLDRLRGSSTIVQPARVIWAIDTPDLTDRENHRLSVIKNNLARFTEPIGFKVTDTGLIFGKAPEPPRKETRVDVAADLLLSLLRKHPLSPSEIEAEAKGAGISWASVRRAKEKLNIPALKKKGRWLWSLPAEEEKELF